MKILAPVTEDWALPVDRKQGKTQSHVWSIQGPSSFCEVAVVSHVAVLFLLSILFSSPW